MLESPILTLFTDLGLAEPVLRAVAGEGYTEPTPIQSQLIPAMLAGKDILGIAQTGTGKTAAFVLPILNTIASGAPRVGPLGCRALVLVPTRELAQQVADSIRAYGRHVRHSCAVVVGGVSAVPQKRSLSRGVDVVIATPGRLEDLMSTRAVVLDRTELLVLDEADQMLDLGFHPAIKRVVAKVPAGRQTVLLSATMPQAIRGLANDLLDKPVEISVKPQSTPIERIEQTVHHLESAAKRAFLVEVLNRPEVERAIVFTRTKHGADKVTKHLETAGLAAAAIHGNKSQVQRRKALEGFRRGRIDVLVATDIAARGIDVDDISHVINFELPNVPEVYVHRIGRTARAGKAGIAMSLCDGSERPYLRDIERLTGTKITPVGHVPPEVRARPTPAQTRNPRHQRRSNASPAGAKAAHSRPHKSRKRQAG